MILNRKSPDVFADVAKFTELAQPDMLVPHAERVSDKAINLAIKLIEEECNKEYIPALHKYLVARTRENLIEVIDGAMDSIYVIAWAMRVLNVPAQAMWNEVQRSNMAKFKKRFNVSNMMDDDSIPPEPHESTPKDVVVEVNARGNYWVLTNAQTGKVIKPANWTQPDLFKVLEEHETIQRIRSQPDGVAVVFMKNYFHEMENRRDRGEVIDT